MINWSEFTGDNGNIKTIAELLFLSVVMGGSLSAVANVQTGVKAGKKIDGLLLQGLEGVASQGCNPTFEKLALQGVEKTWELDEWQIARDLCYSDIKGALKDIALKNGIAVEDLTADQITTDVFVPYLKNSINDMLWRLAWLGDKAALNTGEGGVITAGVDKKYFTVVDGLFKRLFASVTAGNATRVTIAANSASTFAEQTQGLFVKGTPMKIFDDLKYSANYAVWERDDVQVLATKSLVDALAWDIKESNKGGDLAYTDLVNGMQTVKYNGMTIVELPIWDRMIRAYEKGEAAYNKPHRAVLASKTDLLIGTGSDNSLDQFDYGYERKSGTNWFKAKDTLGTQIVEDNLISFAY